MRIAFELNAEPRDGQGKGASRRLRHSGKVPAILYGAHLEPPGSRSSTIACSRWWPTRNSIRRSCSLKVGEQHAGGDRQGRADAPGEATPWCTSTCSACSRTRRSASTCRSTSRARPPLPGVKSRGRRGVAPWPTWKSVCLPKDLPEFLELDLSGMHLNESLLPGRRQGAAGRDHLGAGAWRQSAGGLDPRAARRGTGAEPPRSRPPHPPRAPSAAAAPVREAAAAAAAARRKKERGEEGRPEEGAPRSSRSTADAAGRPGSDAPAGGRRLCGTDPHGRRATQADRRARQPGPEYARTRHNAGFWLRRRAGAASAGRACAASRATDAELGARQLDGAASCGC